MKVLFDCHGCGLKNAEATVRDRLAGEDLMSWMATVQRVVGRVHNEKSPRCRHGKCDLKIPLGDEAQGVGYREKEA